ncbi:MAG: efflux RND transporter periplasmic adaptor subunit [Pirellulales bacterium]
MKRVVIIFLLVAVAGGAAAWWWFSREHAGGPLVLFGNVDLRQVDLAFNNSQRIDEVLVQEGDRVERGQVVARLDTSRLEPQVAQAEAQVAALRQVVERMHNGTRPEEIEQARANLQSAEVDAANARRLYQRMHDLAEESKGGAVSKQEVDNSKAAMDMADAQTEVRRNTLALALAGPRKEDVAEAEANLRAQEAQLALLKQELSDAQLLAPVKAIVRSRVMEPGEMASPARPVLMLAVIDPKWVRAYVAEPDLGRVRQGGAATVQVDSFPDRSFSGWVGFISPVAEFTPKSVQTEELRTNLVYEVRVFVKDPHNELHLGMPATVRLLEGERGGPDNSAPTPPAAHATTAAAEEAAHDAAPVSAADQSPATEEPPR